eukprot:1289022-Pyramimonas_sp.AAC.1
MADMAEKLEEASSVAPQLHDGEQEDPRGRQVSPCTVWPIARSIAVEGGRRGRSRGGEESRSR